MLRDMCIAIFLAGMPNLSRSRRNKPPGTHEGAQWAASNRGRYCLDRILTTLAACRRDPCIIEVYFCPISHYACISKRSGGKCPKATSKSPAFPVEPHSTPQEDARHALKSTNQEGAPCGSRARYRPKDADRAAAGKRASPSKRSQQDRGRLRQQPEAPPRDIGDATPGNTPRSEGTYAFATETEPSSVCLPSPPKCL